MLPRLKSFGSFNVSANASEAAASHLGSSRSRLGLGFRIGLGSEGLVHISVERTLIFFTLPTPAVQEVVKRVKYQLIK